MVQVRTFKENKTYFQKSLLDIFKFTLPIYYLYYFLFISYE